MRIAARRGGSVKLHVLRSDRASFSEKETIKIETLLQTRHVAHFFFAEQTKSRSNLLVFARKSPTFGMNMLSEPQHIISNADMDHAMLPLCSALIGMSPETENAFLS